MSKTPTFESLPCDLLISITCWLPRNQRHALVCASRALFWYLAPFVPWPWSHMERWLTLGTLGSHGPLAQLQPKLRFLFNTPTLDLRAFRSLCTVTVKLPRSQAGPPAWRLPDSLRALIIDSLSSCPPPGALPPKLKVLDLKQFNSPIEPGVVPQSLRILSLGDYFEQPIAPGILPRSMSILTVGSRFKQPLAPGALPRVVDELTFGHGYNHPSLAQPGVLPAWCRRLKLGSGFLHDLPAGVLPNNLHTLSFDNSRFHVVGRREARQVLVLPHHLKRLELAWWPRRISALPNGLRDLCVDRVSVIDELPTRLPRELRTLIISVDRSSPLPPTWCLRRLRVLFLLGRFNDSLDSRLPPTLRTLVLGSLFNQPLGSLPSGLHVLRLGDSFNQPLGSLPSSLRVLKFGDSFNQPLGLLPSSLQVLRLGDSFNQPLSLLPPCLRSLRLGDGFQQSLIGVKWPPSLRELELPCHLYTQELGVPSRIKVRWLHPDCLYPPNPEYDRLGFICGVSNAFV